MKKAAIDYLLAVIGIILLGVGLILVKGIADPNLERQMQIDKKDERNIAISNMAKAKAFELMTFVFGALMISFAMMGVEIIAVLLLGFSYLFVQGYAIYCRSKYDSEM